MGTKQNLIGTLAHWLAAGKLEGRVVLPGIEKLAGARSESYSLVELLDQVGGETDEVLAGLAAHLRQTLRQEALQAHANRRQPLPTDSAAMLEGLCLEVGEGWGLPGDPDGAVEAVIEVIGDVGFLAANQNKVPAWFGAASAAAHQALARAGTALAGPFERVSFGVWQEIEAIWVRELQDGYPKSAMERVVGELKNRWLDTRRAWFERAKERLRDPSPGPIAADVERPDLAQFDETALLALIESRFHSATSRAAKARLLDCAGEWLTPGVVPALLKMSEETWARDRVMLNLTLRFGEPSLASWEDWQRWLSAQASLWQAEQEGLKRLASRHPEGLLLIRYSQLPDADPSVVDALRVAVAQRAPVIEVRALGRRWAGTASAFEQRVLLDLAERSAGPVPPVIATFGGVAATPNQASLQPQASPGSAPARVATPTTPPRSSAWQTHIQPFFAENWYMVAGIAMVILGSSLLAYFTWDKNWLLRYTIMPSLLALFTWSLAGTGRWIEKKSAEFKDTATILRGAAIALLPINFMATAVLSADPNVPQKVPALMAMAVIYLSVFGWGLRGWCSAVEPSLGKPLAGALLLLNALVVVGPWARTVGHLDGQELLICLGAGFYLGFFVAAATLVHFTRCTLTREMAEKKRVPWFVATALGFTFLQVFIWVHGFMRHLPQAQTYALLVILTGWLVLHSERRALQLKGSAQLHGGESFLGFALVLLGILMGFGQPGMRILCFATAGVVWLYQGLSRKHALHYWIALTLWALGVASVGLLPSYPGQWLPALGLALVLGFGMGNTIGRRRHPELAIACRGMQVVTLILTTMVAPLAQWHYRSAPLATAGWLAIVAVLVAWRAARDQNLRWLHATLVVVALVLPYAGCMDVAEHTAHHNTMVFGLAVLSWLWLAVTWLKPAPLVLQARSTGLWFFGILALAAMVLRVVLGDAHEGLWLRDCMDSGGPILMMLALIPATYYSRSIAPAGVAVVMMAILFPELRASLQQSLPWLSWGTGFESSAWGLALVWLCFWLRPWGFLKALPEGDRFLGREPFPFRRHDHSLFTLPIMAAALFLIIKVDTWNLFQYAISQEAQLKTPIALGLTGIAWTFIAIYHREQRAAALAVHLGWLAMLAGLGLGYWHRAAAPQWTWPFLALGLLLQGLYGLYRFQIETARPWARALLTEPTRMVLLTGSGALSLLCIGLLLDGANLEPMQWFYGFLAAQLIWHALAARHRAFGTILFFHVWIGVLAATTPGSAPLWIRVSAEQGLSASLWLLIAIHVLFVGLEPIQASRPRVVDWLCPLVLPPFAIASALAVLLGLAGLVDGVHGLAFSPWQQALLMVALLLTARAQTSNLVLLPAMVLGYEMIHRGLLAALDSPEAGLALLATPWRLALLGLGMTLVAQGGCFLHRRRPGVLAGPFAQSCFIARSLGWLFIPAITASVIAAAIEIADPTQRNGVIHIWAPYIATATIALVAWFWGRRLLFAGAGLFLFLANIHLVRVLVGPWLRQRGLAELHLICLGAALTLLQSSGLRLVVRPAVALAAINRASLGLAGLVLALLTANYITDPNLPNIQSARFMVSGTLAWLSGQYFRRAARRPDHGEEAYADVCEALYHFGVVLAMWCAALLIPWFRQPLCTLAAIALPLAYFYVRAELCARANSTEARRYRNSAAVLGFIVLGLYVFKGVLQLVMFPGATIPTDYYHYNAPLILLLSVMLLRLHGLGGTTWLAFYGGLGLMTGSFFLLTALPGFSPFGHAMPAAWCALGLGHFWILVSYARSPLRTCIQRLARLQDPAWHSLRHYWGLFLIAATQGVTLLGIADYENNTFMVAPLLAGAATILIHQGCIRRSPLYLLAAACEIALALHMDFLVPSYLPRDLVIWALLGIWLALLALPQVLALKLAPETVGRVALALAALSAGQVFYHRPWSASGLWGAGLAALLAGSTPMRQLQATNAVEEGCAALLLAVPVWLAYFSQAPFETNGLDAALQSWPILAASAMLLLVGVFARAFSVYWAAGYFARPRTRFRLIDATLAWIESSGSQVQEVILWLVLGIAGATQVVHYQQPFTPREFTVLALIEASLAAAWFQVGRGRQSMLACYMMQVAAVACCATLRRQLMLTTTIWSYEYDVWASLAFSCALAGAKQVLDVQPRALRVPMLTTLLVLPAMALAWVILHGLGVDLAMIVVGLHSVLFVYLGKDDRESPYNILALGGFVGFVLLTFYSKLHFQALHAYVIPVGMGVLALQHLFQRRTPPEAQNWVRLITLLAMIGSSAYYALVDDRHAITFNLTLILLGLLAMGLGSLLRIRLYLALGFAGLMVDLVSILYKVLVHMERSQRMTVVGSLVLLLGALVVFGAIYYKTNKSLVDAWINERRQRFGAWS